MTDLTTTSPVSPFSLYDTKTFENTANTECRTEDPTNVISDGGGSVERKEIEVCLASESEQTNHSDSPHNEHKNNQVYDPHDMDDPLHHASHDLHTPFIQGKDPL
jgi:hypothetical protein